MLLENVFSKIIKTFPKNPLNSKNYSVTNVTAFCKIFTPAMYRHKLYIGFHIPKVLLIFYSFTTTKTAYS